MTQTFLDQLPRLAKEELSDNNICLICQEEYKTPHSDSEAAEEAVRLPCPGAHIVGLKCISSWFSTDIKKTSCPCCRYKFTILTTPFQNGVRQPRNSRTERLERWRNQWREFRSVLVSAGGKPEPVQGWDSWFRQWHEAASMPNGEAEIHRASGSAPGVSGTLTLHFREYYYYVLRRSRNALTMDILDGPKGRLTGSDKAGIFTRLRRKGAFQGVLEEVQSVDERWRILRSLGYVFDEERRVWSACSY